MLELPEFYYEIEDSEKGIHRLKISSKPLKHKSEKVYIEPYPRLRGNIFKNENLANSEDNYIAYNNLENARNICSLINEGFSIFNYQTIKKLIYLNALFSNSLNFRKDPPRINNYNSNVINIIDSLNTIRNPYQKSLDYFYISNTWRNSYYELIDGIYIGIYNKLNYFIVGDNLPYKINTSEVPDTYKLFPVPDGVPDNTMIATYIGNLYWGKNGEIVPNVCCTYTNS